MPARVMSPRRLLPVVLVVAAVLAAVVTVTALESPNRTAHAAQLTPVQRWLGESVPRIAHHGGDADWPAASPLAYERSAAWNATLALEVSVRRTLDGVWVASENASTGSVYDRDLVIARSTWAQLSTLRSKEGDQPMSRLQQTVLDRVASDRVVLVDDKAGADVSGLLDLLGRYGGPSRFVVKSYGPSTTVTAAARARGYTTWGYYYPSDMTSFARTQDTYDLLGVPWNAPADQWRTVLATHKRIFAFIVATRQQADAGLAAGATGLMVSGVTQVVPQG